MDEGSGEQGSSDDDAEINRPDEGSGEQDDDEMNRPILPRDKNTVTNRPNDGPSGTGSSSKVLLPGEARTGSSSNWDTDGQFVIRPSLQIRKRLATRKGKGNKQLRRYQ